MKFRTKSSELEGNVWVLSWFFSLILFPSPLSQGQPSTSDDPADAWFNAAGILLSLKHAAAERSARMGNPIEVSQWNPSTSEPPIAQPQVCNYQLVQAFITFFFPPIYGGHPLILKNDGFVEKLSLNISKSEDNSIEILDHFANIRLGNKYLFKATHVSENCLSPRCFVISVAKQHDIPSFCHTVVTTRTIRWRYFLTG